MNGYGRVTPEAKLADLKQLAPWFYDYIPKYVMERAEWFDHWYVQSISVYAEDGKHPHMLEIYGCFDFTNDKLGHKFEDYFEPNVFRRFHCRGGEDFTSTRPCRKADVLVVEDGGWYRVRFLVDARYDPQPELRMKAYPPGDTK